jgi:class 3 adenylate cyclase
MQGERRLVTVLFCDVAGSTAMAERMDPEEWAEVMNEAFGLIIAPVNRYGGTVARLLGDALMAYFGAPVAHEDDPERAVLTALSMLEEFAPFRERFRSDYGTDFDIRIGINTGRVVVGGVGGSGTEEYTVMGDAVNVAARMETSRMRSSTFQPSIPGIAMSSTTSEGRQWKKVRTASLPSPTEVTS